MVKSKRDKRRVTRGKGSWILPLPSVTFFLQRKRLQNPGDYQWSFNARSLCYGQGTLQGRILLDTCHFVARDKVSCLQRRVTS